MIEDQRVAWRPGTPAAITHCTEPSNGYPGRGERPDAL